MPVPVVVAVLEDASVVVVEVVAALTVIDTVLDVLVAYVLDPPYTALTE